MRNAREREESGTEDSIALLAGFVNRREEGVIVIWSFFRRGEVTLNECSTPRGVWSPPTSGDNFCFLDGAFEVSFPSSLACLPALCVPLGKRGFKAF